MKDLFRMKRTLLLFATTSLILTTSACSSNSSGSNQQEVPKDSAAQSNVETSVSFGTEGQQGTVGALQAYFILKDALVSEDATTAHRAATSILAALGDVNDDPLVSEIIEDAQHIAETSAVSHQRDHLNTLSDNLLALLEREESLPAAVYQIHCPMARDGKGANWMSLTDEVRNPYFGNKMLKCGSVVATLK